MIELQGVLGYGGLAAGASLLPINALMLALSPRAGRWGERWGPRVPIAAGSLVAAAGLALFSRVGPGSRYLVDVPPATLVFGAGLGTLIAPLTASVLAVAEEGRTGIASAVNNATARLAGLLATALVPLAVGIAGLESFTGPAFAAGFRRAMLDLGRPLRGGRGPGLAHRARGHRERLRAAPKPGTFTDDLSWSGLPEPT
jgi:hypothetical protein